jgi:Trk K+ transport system NAD-binding subunit
MRALRDFDGLHPRDLSGRQRLLAVYVFCLVTTVLVYTFLYNVGMRTLEGRPQPIFRSLNAVVATLTTTGYGADSPWTSPLMLSLLVTMQVTGVVIGFVTLRVLIIPLFERAPLTLDDRLSMKANHVVVAEYRRDTDLLLDELESLDVGYVLLESDQEEAKRHSDDGYQAIHGDPEDGDDLDRASIAEASLLITDAGDRTASIALTALERNEDLRVVSFTPTMRRTAALTEVGVDRSVAPHRLIGRRLAEKAATPVAVEASGDGNDLVVREVLVRRNSSIQGTRLGDSAVANHPNLTLVAGWFGGELRVPPSPDERLTADAVLVVAGPEDDIAAATGDLSNVRSPLGTSRSSVVVAGFGEGGHAALDALPEDTSVTTVDADGSADPDVVGDSTEPETLREAGIEDASALIVTVDDDATALLTVAIARSLSDDIEILGRVTETDKAAPAFRAGADYVLSVQQVCARLVASEAHGEGVVSPAGQIRLVRADAAPFAGEKLADAGRDAERGWIVIGAVRDGTVKTEGSVVVESDDDLLVAGGDDAIQSFERTVDTA